MNKIEQLQNTAIYELCERVESLESEAISIKAELMRLLRISESYPVGELDEDYEDEEEPIFSD